MNNIKSRMFKTETEMVSSHLELYKDQIISFLQENGGNHVSHLILLGDKDVFWASERKVLIVYKRIANKLVVLGDPIGDETYFSSAIKEFYEYSENRGCQPIFYQISPRLMHYYHESGYRFLKLGEEGIVNLQNFTLEGKQAAKLRTSFNKFTRNACTFSVIHPPYSDKLLSELKMISDKWLGNQKEKGFSVVSFSEEYVSCFPLALLCDHEGNSIAFATLASDYKKSISIDLMRKDANSPNGTMDVLFIHILNWAKDKGYATCSLGMAPLSNVGNCRHSFISEKLLGLAYHHGNSLYNFKGLKEFKGKFACTWEPKYLAYKNNFLPAIFIQLLLLINRPPKLKVKVVEKMRYLFTKAG